MSILTPFFNLIKPAKQDGVKVSDFNANMDTIDTEMHRPPLTVNNIEPDANRDIYIQSVPLADNLTSDEAQINIGTYLERTSGGSSSIESGDASLSTIKGNMIKTGYVAEVIDMTVNAVPRVAPPAITATIDNATFEEYVETAGTYTLTYTDGWDEDPTDYGITVTNDPVDGDEIVVVWDGENDPVMTVNAVERPVPPAITATIDKATFRAYVATSGTVTLSYTSAWSASPALYGITVQNTPVSGDSIVGDYVKENRGTITPANVSAFNSTGWNLYDNDTGYAKVIKYSDTYGYYIGGNYSIVAFATTPTGTPSAVTVNDGYFNIPSDGYIIITGGDATTYIFQTWSDWIDGYEGDFEPYTVDTINLSSIMVSFTAGLCAVGEVRDELNFNIQKAYSRIDRMAYTAENLAAVIATGRAYDTDTNYIYVVRETPVEYSFSIDGTYSVSDHGIEYFTASTTTPVICETLYGENLKDKLRTDVLTISQQTLSSNQQAQVRENIGAADDADTKAAFAIVENGNNATNAISSGEYVIWKGAVYTADSNIAVGTTLVDSGTGKNLTACTKGGLNSVYSSLNSNLSALTSPTVWADWNSLTPLYNSSSWNGSFYTKVGKIVFLEISVKELTANTNAVIAQLPTGYRPLMSIEWDGFGGNAYLNHAHFKINASTGDISVYSADTYATGFISFPAM